MFAGCKTIRLLVLYSFGNRGGIGKFDLNLLNVYSRHLFTTKIFLMPEVPSSIIRSPPAKGKTANHISAVIQNAS